MLAKTPEDRPQTASDVAEELSHFVHDADLIALAEECRTSLDMPSADVDITDDVSFIVSRATKSENASAVQSNSRGEPGLVTLRSSGWR